MRSAALRWVVATVSVVAELVVSRRGLALVALGAAGVLTAYGGLRPALRQDISSINVPLEAHESVARRDGLFDDAELLDGLEPAMLTSVGGLMLLLITVGATVALLDPRRVDIVAGVVLAGAVASTAALCLNHPELVERLDLELEERQWVARTIWQRETSPLTVLHGGRAVSTVAAEGESGGVTRGADYLVYGHWVIPLAGMLLLLGARGPLSSRLGSLSAWGGLGIVLACVVCRARLLAERHWHEAVRLEELGDCAGARTALERAMAQCEPLAHLQRTWLFAGRLDHVEGRSTPQAGLFRARQLGHNGKRAEGRAELEDLLTFCGSAHPEALRASARLMTLIGLEDYRDRRYGAAGAAWTRAAELDPVRLDLSYFLGTLRLDVDPMHPELAQQDYGPILRQLADRRIRADISATLGEACFGAGRFDAARRHFRESMDAFNRPNAVNVRSWRGLAGL